MKLILLAIIECFTFNIVPSQVIVSVMESLDTTPEQSLEFEVVSEWLVRCGGLNLALSRHYKNAMFLNDEKGDFHHLRYQDFFMNLAAAHRERTEEKLVTHEIAQEIANKIEVSRIAGTDILVRNYQQSSNPFEGNDVQDLIEFCGEVHSLMRKNEVHF